MTVEGQGGSPAAGVPAPQAVLEASEPSATFLVATVNEGGEERVRGLLPKLASLVRAVRSRAPGSRLSCIVGIGCDAWDRLFTGPPPAQLHPFREVAGEGRRAISTPADLLFHIRATSSDLCFELAAEIVRSIQGAATVQDEVIGFKYFGELNMLGFADGTENPTGQAASDAVLVGSEDRRHAGGAYVVVQKYLHDLASWNALTVEQQQRIIGRTKTSNIELDGENQAPDSHVALNKVIGPDGAEQQILRFNMPFGSAARGEYGTYFIGYARCPAVIEQMLRNMFLGTASASYDKILDFSRAVTGALFFAPSTTFLDNLPGPGDPGQWVTLPHPAATGAGSLHIGSLRRVHSE
ncbi:MULTISPECIES: Dyp-type peroxidase [unclassified Streptomyces]|uniref:Dyp-type peroxidase n=1 Tax=unclassified Streptomyces TaxID=2593676 RepID=UPI00068AE13C